MAFAVAGMIGAAGWFGYSLYHAPQKVIAAKQEELDHAQAELDQARGELAVQEELVVEQQGTITSLNTEIVKKDERIVAQDEQIARLDTAMRLLKVDHRLAELRILQQKEDAETGKIFSTIEFVEVNDDGGTIDEPRRLEIEGDLVYVECLVAKFEDKYVESSDLHRATSICLFQRIFGEFQEPSRAPCSTASGLDRMPTPAAENSPISNKRSGTIFGTSPTTPKGQRNSASVQLISKPPHTRSVLARRIGYSFVRLVG